MPVTPADISHLLAAPLPRQVPPQVAKAARTKCPGWGTAIAGSIVLVWGLIFLTVGVLPWRPIDDWRLASARANATAGAVIAAVPTGKWFNSAEVIEYRFAYTPEGNAPRTGHCYHRGEGWKAGDKVDVLYLQEQPELACIKGARLSLGPWGAVAFLALPILGGGIALGWFFTSRRRIRAILLHGAVAEAQILSVDETTMEVNYKRVYRIVIRAPSINAGRPVTIKRVNRPEIDLALARVREQQPVFVLHDPKRPRRLLFPEAWIGL